MKDRLEPGLIGREGCSWCLREGGSEYFLKPRRGSCLRS